MKIISGKTGSPHVTSQQFRQIFEGIIGDESCILPCGENLTPELQTNNSLKIRSGLMYHHGNVSTVELGTYDEVTIQNGTQGMKRIDLVVNRYAREEESGTEKNEWVVIQGTPQASDPAVPDYTEGNLQDGDLVDDCPYLEVHLDGINVVEIKQLLSVANAMSTINKYLAEKSYDPEELHFADFWNITAFVCRKQGNKVFFNASFQTNAIVQANHMYDLNTASIPSELLPAEDSYLNAIAVAGDWTGATACVCNVLKGGTVEFMTPAVKAFYKISGSWITAS